MTDRSVWFQFQQSQYFVDEAQQSKVSIIFIESIMIKASEQ